MSVTTERVEQKVKDTTKNKYSRSQYKRERNSKPKDYLAVASVRMVRMTPRKARLTANMIRNKNVEQAVAILKLTNNKAAPIILKVLNSAISNAEDLKRKGTVDFQDQATLYVAKILINDGPIIKRIRPRAKGSASPINKRTAHVVIELKERSE